MTKLDSVLLLIVIGFAAGVFFFTLEPLINTDNAIDAIVGEASNQDYDTMVCIAQGIRHRGNFKGVYGLHAAHNAQETTDTWENAGQAWEDSDLIKDQIHGAKNWGTYEDITKSYIPWGNIKAKCGDFYFY